MGKQVKNAKWTRGKSTVERPTKRTKQNLALHQRVLHLPLKMLNHMFSK